MPILDYVITDHAAFEMKRRDIREELVRTVLAAPEQQMEARSGRTVFQSRISFGTSPNIYLVRVFVGVDRHPAEVVTVYFTNKISKYWKEDVL